MRGGAARVLLVPGKMTAKTTRCRFGVTLIKKVFIHEHGKPYMNQNPNPNPQRPKGRGKKGNKKGGWRWSSNAP